MAAPEPRRVAGVAQDLAGLAGAALITRGVDLVYHPAAYIIGGAFLLVGAWRSARRAAS